MKYRILSIILLLVLALNVLSCGTNIDEIESKFSKYKSDNNIVAILDSSVFYFADHTLKLDDIVEGEESNQGYLFYNGKLYFSTSRQNGLFDFSFSVYECDLYGNNKTRIFEKHGYKTRPWADGNGETLYLLYYETNAFDASSKKIDCYNVITGLYENVSEGKDSYLGDYRKDRNSKYSFTFDDGIVTIIDEKNETYRVDKEKLLDSNFGEALEDFEYTYSGRKVTDEGQILLFYRIKSNGPMYPHFVCEYVPNTDEVILKLLFFSYDVEGLEIDCIA